jgi:hypothetical protein
MNADISLFAIRLIAAELLVGLPIISLRLVGVAADAATNGLEAAVTASANLRSCRRLIVCSSEKFVIVALYIFWNHIFSQLPIRNFRILC